MKNVDVVSASRIRIQPQKDRIRNPAQMSLKLKQIIPFFLKINKYLLVPTPVNKSA